MSQIIEIDSLRKSFGGNEALKGISFSVEKGEIFGLVGPDGAGKTTTVRIAAGVMKIDSGTVIVGGFNVKEQPAESKKIIGYMPQKFSLYQDLSVEENIDFFADLFDVRSKQREIMKKDLYAFSRLEKFKGRPAGKLSGGMQKKLALACALINIPELLILDEPTIGVDPLSRQELWEMLIKLNKERHVSILVTTSYMDEVERCGRVGLLYEGTLLRVAKLEDILSGGKRFEEIFVNEMERQKKIKSL